MSAVNNDSIVLEEEIDPNYVPSDEEVVEYATWMGMDLDADRDLFWIAREGLMAPLPADWKPCKSTESEDVYYFNFETAESSWDHPCDGYYKRLYEEEKKKKEVSKKAENDTVRTKARQDVDQLLGKSSKKKLKGTLSKTPGKGDGGDAVALSLASYSGMGGAAEKKALPGIRGKPGGALADPSPLRNSMSVSRDSTPERGRSEHKGSGGGTTVSRPASADAILGGGSGRGMALGSLSSLSAAAPQPIIAMTKSSTASSTNGSDHASSPEFTDSDVSPTKRDNKQTTAIGREEKKNERSISKNSRVHNAVAISSDFSSPDSKMRPTTSLSSGGISDAGIKPKAVLGKIGGYIPPPADVSPAPVVVPCSTAMEAKVDGNIYRQSSVGALNNGRDDYEKLKNEINRLSVDNSNLSENVTTLTVDINKEQKKNDVLSTSVNVLQTQLSTAREESRNMRSELNREIERRARIESELKEVNTQWANAKKENATHVVTIQDMRAQIHNLEGEINLSNNAASSLADLSEPPVYSPKDVMGGGSREIDSLQEKLKDSQMHVLKVEALMIKLETDKQKLETEAAETIGQLERSVRSLEQKRDRDTQSADCIVPDFDADNLKSRILELEEELRLRDSMVVGGGGDDVSTSSNIELSKAKLYQDELNEKILKLSLELSAVQRDNEEYAFKTRRLESQVSIRQSELEDTESRLSAMKRRVSEMQDRCDDAELQQKSLTTRLSAECDDKNRAETRLSAAKEDIKSLSSQVASLERLSLGAGGDGDTGDSMRLLIQEVDVLKSRCLTYQSEQDAIVLKLAQKDDDIARTQFELATQVEITDSLRRASTVAHSSDTTEITDVLKAHERDMLEKLKVAQIRESSLQDDLDSLRRRAVSLEEELQQARGQVTRMENKEDDTLQLLAKRETQAEESEQRCTDLRRELSELSLKQALHSSSEVHKTQTLELELDRCRAQLQEAASLHQRTFDTQDTKGGKDVAGRAVVASVYELEGLRNANKFVQSELDISNKRNKSLETELHLVRDEKEKMYFETVHSKGMNLEAFNEKLSVALEAQNTAQAELMPLRLRVEELTMGTTTLQNEIITLKKDAERRADLEVESVSARDRVAALDKRALQEMQEENRVLHERIRVFTQELGDSVVQVKSLEQQVHGLGLDKQRLREALEAASRHSGDGDKDRELNYGFLRQMQVATSSDNIRDVAVESSAAATVQLAVQREKEIARLQNEIQVLTSQREALRVELSNKASECYSHLNTIAELKQRINIDGATTSRPHVESYKAEEAAISTATQQAEAKQFFDTLMVSYQAKMEAAMQQQLGTTERLKGEREKGAMSSGNDSGTKGADCVRVVTDAALLPSWEDKDDTPLDTLRIMLGAYMSRGLTSPAHRDRRDDFTLLSTTNGKSSDHMEHLQRKIESEKNLLEDLTAFLKKENDLVRRKQHSLSVDRDEWRRRYQQRQRSQGENNSQQRGRHNEDHLFRSAKKASGEQLNARAESLNEMVHELRQIQAWVSAREDKLSRLTGVWRSLESMYSRQQEQEQKTPHHHSSMGPSSSSSSTARTATTDRSGLSPEFDISLVGHMEMLHRLKADLDDDISLISMQAVSESATKDRDREGKAVSGGTLSQPKQAFSPERGSRGGGVDRQTDGWLGNGRDVSAVRVSGEQAKPPPKFERNESQSYIGGPSALSAGQYVPSSAMFACRLGSGSGGGDGKDIKSYSNSLRSSLNAYDLHADWLGNLKKEVSRFGSGAALRHSYSGSSNNGNVFGALKGDNAETLIMHDNYSNRNAKKMTDFLSHTKSVFSYPGKGVSYNVGDENTLPQSGQPAGRTSGCYTSKAGDNRSGFTASATNVVLQGSNRSCTEVGGGLRKSVDNAEMINGRGGKGNNSSSNIYRL